MFPRVLINCFIFSAITMENLSIANSRFALDLLRRFSEANPTGNVFFSPVSISAALAMVLLGSKGNTEAQVLKVSKIKWSLIFYFIYIKKGCVLEEGR